MKTELINIQIGPVAVASPSGRIDAANSRKIRKDFNGCLESTSRIVFDCEQLDFLDSTGLGSLVSCLHKALSAGGDLRLSGLNSKVKMIFELTKAETLFKIYPDAEAAVASFDLRHD
jgi:anti-sigma B factor antagonist